MSNIIKIFRIIWVLIFNKIKLELKDWHIRKVINFSNLCKLAFIYCVSIIVVILIDFETSPNFWKKAIFRDFSDKRIAVYSVRDRIGEGVLYQRMIRVLKEQKYDYVGSSMPEALTHFWFSKHFYYVGASFLNYLLKPKCNLALTHHINVLPYGYNITYLNMPRDSLYTASGDFQKIWSHLNDYDAYADLYTYSHGENKLLEKLAKDKKIIPLYLAQQETIYEDLSINKALITGTLWGCGRGSIRTKIAIKKLAEDGLLVGVGMPDHFQYLGKNYLGRLEDFGKVITALDKLQKEYGIGLVLHNHEHMLDGIPTSRVSEVVSSGSLIISDQNPFIKKFFGDNAFYFDTFGNEEEIYKQIKQHIIWIQNNPEAASAKAKLAHEIFKEKMTIEKHLETLYNTISHF